MKKITYTLLLLLTFGFSYGQTTLAAGDIAFTGANADAPDEFSFVLLTDVLNGTQINFTDFGWNIPSDSFYTAVNEGVVTWTATSDLACGTEIIITDMGSNVYSPTSGIATETDLGFALAANGDQLFAYQGVLASPTLIAGIHFANIGGWTNAISTQTSGVPTSLTDGVNAVYLGNYDNNSYDCSVTTNTPYILAAANDVSNWNGTNAPGRPALSTCGFTCSPCATSTTWNGAWSNGLPNDLSKSVIINTNYITSSGNIIGCSLTVDAGATLTVNSDDFVEIEHNVIIDGTLIVETQGNFVQNDDLGTFTTNGISRVNKQTAAKTDWFFYTYWSSPVIGETIEGVFPDVDGDRRFWFDASNYEDLDGDDIDDNGDDWQYALGGDTMIPGVGYAVTESRFFIGGIGTATFEGAFNTGKVTASISYNPANVLESWNFIGNPYPSAIDFVAFHTANSSVVEGVAYFWSQASPPNNGNSGNEEENFNKNDYAMYTVGTGGVDGGSGVIPDQYIPSGQSFFIAGLDNNTVTFTNAMRMADGTSNTQFFRGSNSKKSNSADNRLWVNLTSDNGVFNQILVGYVNGATNGNDGSSYDAKRLLATDFPATLYSTIENSDKKFAIQGKAINSLTEDEVINLGFATNIDVPTQYKLSLAQIEGGFLTNNTVYLKDNLLSTLHNLSASDYTFTSEVGEFNERFEIVFNANALSTNDIDANSNTLKIVELENDYVQFTASNNTIKSIRIFDLLGRQLYDFKGQSDSETYKLSNLSSAIYIAKVELSNGKRITKKAFKK